MYIYICLNLQLDSQSHTTYAHIFPTQVENYFYSVRKNVFEYDDVGETWRVMWKAGASIDELWWVVL